MSGFLLFSADCLLSGSWWFNIFSLELFIHEYCQPWLRPALKILSSESSQVQPGPEVRGLVAVCQARAGVEGDDLDRLITFTTELLDPVSNGCLSLSRQGAAMGLPHHFTADSLDLKDLLVKTGYNRWERGGSQESQHSPLQVVQRLQTA